MKRATLCILVALVGAVLARGAQASSVVTGPDSPAQATTRPVIAGREQAAHWLDEAARYADATSDAWDRAHLCAGIAIQYARCGELESYQSNILLAEKLLPANSALDQLRARALSDIVWCMALRGKVELARQAIDKYVVAPVDREASLIGMAAGQAEGGDLLGAVATVKTLNPQTYNEAYCRLARALADAGKFEAALQMTDAIHDPTWQSSAHLALAGAYARSGNDHGAMDIADRIPEGPGKAEAYRVISAWRAAWDNDDGAVTVAQMISDPPVQSRAFLAIGRLQVRRQDFSAANKSLEKTIDDDHQQLALQIVLGHCKAGNIRAAKEALRMLANGPLRSRAYQAIAYAMVRENDIFGARSFLDPLPQEQRIVQLLSLARIAAEVGNPDIALRILREVETGVVDPGTRLVGPLIRFKAHDMEGYNKAIKELQAEADNALNPIGQQRANMFLFTIRAICGDVAGAREAAKKVADSNLRFLLSATAQRLDTGDYSDAVHLACALPLVGLQAAAFLDIALNDLKERRADAFAGLVQSLPTPRDRSAACTGIARALLQPPLPTD
jgi:tetratricopeptide (TPR) repeat protein